MQNFELGAAILSVAPRSSEPLSMILQSLYQGSLFIEEVPPGWQGPSDDFASNQSLTAILESEIELPTAGAPIKDHRDRNKGLQGPLYED